MTGLKARCVRHIPKRKELPMKRFVTVCVFLSFLMFLCGPTTPRTAIAADTPATQPAAKVLIIDEKPVAPSIAEVIIGSMRADGVQFEAMAGASAEQVRNEPTSASGQGYMRIILVSLEVTPAEMNSVANNYLSQGILTMKIVNPASKTVINTVQVKSRGLGSTKAEAQERARSQYPVLGVYLSRDHLKL